MFTLLRYVVPGIVLLSLSTVPIPRNTAPYASSAREVAGYFQSLAFVESGLGAFTYVTLQESDAGLHLYSALASPLVSLGYVEGGRLVSIAAAMAAAVTIAYITGQFWGRVAAAVAPAFLLANPYFFRYAWGVVPEAVSVALTAGAIAAMLRYDATLRDRWFLAALALAGMGITNHTWEAVVGLPLAVVLAWRRDWAKFAALIAFIPLMVLLVEFIAGLQSNPVDTAEYAVTNTGLGIFFTVTWWQGWTTAFVSWPGSLFFYAQRWHFLGAFVALGYWSWTLSRRRNMASAVVLGWLLSGLAVPALLPGGVIHLSFLWGLIAPLTITLAHASTRVHSRLVRARSAATAEMAVRLAIVILVGFTVLNAAVVEGGAVTDSPFPYLNDDDVKRSLTDAEHTDAIEAGLAIRESNVEDVSEVVFVGPWQAGSSASMYRSGVVRVLVYSGLQVREQDPRLTDEDGPIRWASSIDRVRDCQLAVVLAPDGSVSVSPCRPSGGVR